MFAAFVTPGAAFVTNSGSANAALNQGLDGIRAEMRRELGQRSERVLRLEKQGLDLLLGALRLRGPNGAVEEEVADPRRRIAEFGEHVADFVPRGAEVLRIEKVKARIVTARERLAKAEERIAAGR